jgi:naringenin degradation protein FdeH
MPRRVVTGHDDTGKSVFLSDGAGPVSRTAPDGASFHELWSTPAAPAPLTATEPDPANGTVSVPPPAHGTKIRINAFPPGVVSPVHRTQSVDYGIMLDEEMVLVLDRWENRSGRPAQMVFVLVDAQFTSELANSLGEVELLRDPLAP